jgi:tRNA nucleotidyltransferase (CCA-adding enzyme)
MIEVFNSVTATILQFDQLIRTEGVQRWIIYFNVLVMQLEPSDIIEIGDRFKVPNDIIRRISFDKEQVHHILRLLSSKTIATSEIYRALENLSLETLLFLISRTRFTLVRSRISRYLTHLRHIKPLITGNILIDWCVNPGPTFKEILKILFDAQLDGLFSTVEGGKEFFNHRLRSICKE